MSNILRLCDLTLSFPHKTCFDGFSSIVYPGDRIAIIGRNGSGKSSLLRLIRDFADNVGTAYIPQIITDFDSCSGGEKFNKALSSALANHPDLLLLDEPTNHLDAENKRSLIRNLQNFRGMLLVVTHDPEVLRRCVDILWHIDDGKITVFNGKYDDYMRQKQAQYNSLQKQRNALDRQKEEAHQNLMKQRERSAKSKASGRKKVENKRWMKSVGDLKGMKAEVAQGKQSLSIEKRKQELTEQMQQLRVPEVIFPKFNLLAQKAADGAVLSVSGGAVGYDDKIILTNISLSLQSGQRLAITGRNGSGKTTLLKAILNNSSHAQSVTRAGYWYVTQSIGFLDQHYQTLNPEKSALEIIADAAPQWDNAVKRRHLNDFLFRKNEEVNTLVKNLSGGERARLSLAQIAANPPKLLILDEITNNLDIETRDNVTQVLRDFPGAVLVVSHDSNFLREIQIEEYYDLD
ncbi:MAG: ATP-binding cassette domain-containing protein [Holosporales bacterium]|nr:ATP-binding cassette domain-containing protein [Holosporales bacterium]